MSATPSTAVPSAALLVIGDEILSGRTADVNIAHTARFLTARGIDLREVRVVPDVEADIIAAVNALRARYDHLFTTGGIGPTHDDITADAIARAFGVGIEFHPEAMKLLAARYAPGEFNDMRKRMARVPLGANLVKNSVSAAPGFHIGNVFVLAGVPMIMRAMLEAIEPLLPRGAVVHSATVSAEVPEGKVAAGLAAIQKDNPDVALGSYPFYRENGYGVQLVARGRDADAVEKAARALENMLKELGAQPSRIA